MPTLDEHQSASVVRLLNIGESGTGKTGALASLALAGYNLHILDYDNGLDILANIIRTKDATALKRIQFETLRDKIVTRSGKPQVASPPTGFTRAAEVLTKWKADEFGPKDVLVLDTLNTFSKCAFNYALFSGQRLNQKPQIQDYGTLADRVMLFIEMLTAEDMKCNLVVNTHIRYFDGDEDTGINARGLPAAIGKQIPQNVSIYFNTVVLSRSIGSGAGAKRVISTQPQGVIEVKTSNPIGVKAQYSIETGLADLFRDITGSNPGAQA